MLLYVHRNRRFIRDGSPGRPPRLSHSFLSSVFSGVRATVFVCFALVCCCSLFLLFLFVDVVLCLFCLCACFVVVVVALFLLFCFCCGFVLLSTKCYSITGLGRPPWC